MSKPQDLHRPSLPFGNPFRMLLPKGAYLSPKLLELLNAFEESLAEKLRKLKPANVGEMLHLPWMKSLMESLCEIHSEIKTFITALDLPVNDWEDKWIDAYLDNSVKLLDICIAFTSEISHLKQGQLVLQFALHNLKGDSSKQFLKADSSLSEWRQHIASKNPRLEKSFGIMDSLAETLDLPKIKNSAKGKILMRAMYGVKVVSLLVCSVFAATLSGSAKKLMDVHVSETYKWAGAFTDLQIFVNTELKNVNMTGMVVVKELQDVDATVKKVCAYIEDGAVPIEALGFQSSKEDLEKSVEIFSNGMNLLGKEVDSFFQILLTGRDALLSTLRIGGDCDQK